MTNIIQEIQRTIQHMGQPNRNIVLTLKKHSSKDNFYQDNKDWHLLRNLTRTTNNTLLNRLQHPYYCSYSQKKKHLNLQKNKPQEALLNAYSMGKDIIPEENKLKTTTLNIFVSLHCPVLHYINSCTKSSTTWSL